MLRYCVFLAPLVIAQAKDDPVISALATCQQSMFDWRDPERQKRILEKFESKADYAIERGYYLIPRKPATLLGFRIIELSPTGLGKALGFSAFVEGRFDTVRRTLEAHIGHKLEQCHEPKGGRLCVRLELGWDCYFTSAGTGITSLPSNSATYH